MALTAEYIRHVPSYDQIKKLESMLSDAGVPHEYRVDTFEEEDIDAWYDIKVPSNKSFFDKNKGFSIVLNGGSFGHHEGLLEVWFKPDMEYPIGGYTADEVFDMIMSNRKVWEEA